MTLTEIEVTLTEIALVALYHVDRTSFIFHDSSAFLNNLMVHYIICIVCP